MKKICFLVLALLFVILLANRVSTEQNLDENIHNMIGCLDYDYKFNVSTPVEVKFYVTQSNGEDKEGFFKYEKAEGESSTVLHCGNNYHVVYSAEGYKDYEEDLVVKGFKPIFESTKQIVLEKE